MSMEEGSSPCDGETQAAQLPSQAFDRTQQCGGWITFPFITGSEIFSFHPTPPARAPLPPPPGVLLPMNIHVYELACSFAYPTDATMAGLTLAAGGWINNFIVFLIGEFNVKSIEAAQLWNVVNGCTSMFPVLGAIVADSFLGNFTVICISSLFSLLGIILLLLCSTIDSLRPPPCDQNGPTSCITASRLQLSILYLAITLATIGLGGTRFTIGALGADQFDDPRHQGSFFNWYLFTLYTASAISATAVVYVEDNVSWGWGFGICAAANVVGLAIFVSGSRFYRPVKPKGSPFTGLARVVVAAVQKRNLVVSSKSEDYYNRADNGGVNLVAATPTGAFK
ncbi:hypothetical protein RHSIM_Rhsim13G0090800 [Rhododendron simsii]|uniref:Uncharacterized protein n=1 Tax=Rhododendron simsii TaxID=118357 RepID=A0A834FZ53_RHOSS|nr:hypothetical protein RHSIM_Rhsim13G0090800 [Rhododendron simsii]